MSHAPKRGYYLHGDDGQPWPEKEWCLTCARVVAKHYRKRRGMRGLQPSMCWAGDETPRYCCGCGVCLDTGGLSDYGVDETFEHFAALEEQGGWRWNEGAIRELVLLLDSLDDESERHARASAWLEAALKDHDPAPAPRSMRELLP